MNGQPLPIDHGAPLRLRVETQLGFTMVKYIRAIEFVENYCQWRRAKGPLWQRHMGPRRQGSMSAKAPAAFDGHADLLTALGRAREK